MQIQKSAVCILYGSAFRASTRLLVGMQEEDHIVVDAAPDGLSLIFKRTAAAAPGEVVIEEIVQQQQQPPAVPSTPHADNGADNSGAAPGQPSSTSAGSTATSTSQAHLVAASPPAGAGGSTAPVLPVRGSVDVPAPARRPKFDPLRKISKLQASGADISTDGSAARSDDAVLPTEAG